MIFGAFNVHGSSHNQAATDRAPRCASTCWRSSSRSCTCPATPSPSPFWASSKLKRSRGKKLGLVVMIMCQVGRKWHLRGRRGQVKERGLFQGNFFFPTYMATTPVSNLRRRQSIKAGNCADPKLSENNFLRGTDPTREGGRRNSVTDSRFYTEKTSGSEDPLQSAEWRFVLL